MEQKYALFDTCSYEKYIKYKTQSLEVPEFNGLENNYLLVISDLTLAELIEGRDSLDSFISFKNTFLKYGFNVFGHSEIMNQNNKSIFLSPNITQKTYKKYRETIIDNKKQYISSIYVETIKRYIVLLITVLAYYDNSFFSPFCHLFIELFKDHQEESNKIFNDVFEIISENKNERKDSLFVTSTMIMEALAKTYKPNYKDNEIEDKMKALNVEIKLSSITSFAIKQMKKKKEYSSFLKLNNVMFLISTMRNNISFELLENSLLYDAISYSVINSGFCQGKYQYNDLVDLCNVAMIGNKEYSFKYFTEEDRWKDFIEIEKLSRVIE